ncbi:bifunctional diguanylate cyclase/phosphodiesterase [Idiomarina piscisalsi]|uniref:putative bifunctional diguanylate cyclase/phosphodiesterase n=1 Tax=Idiomarina piscisalsi TaxID=1096243 RepID=UPI001382C1DC|nr:GGDEF domain-containing phosphodiesterase [Idiomarina piscisalsi]MTJ02884.1 EAL domain-containing protein [Idiomarina piscisalsi]
MTNNRDKQTSEARFHKLFDDTEAMSIQGYRADGSVVYWNAASEKIYGYSTGEALGRSLYDLIIPHEMRDEVKRAVAWMFDNEEGIPPARLNLKHKDGTTVPVYSSHTVVSLPNDEPIMFCMDADMRSLEMAEAEVQRLSYYDSLTDLPNRRLMLERITSVTRNTTVESSFAALLIVDIDNFHSINESLGYEIGDQVLLNCAECLQRFSSSQDALARLGKDEFAVFLPCTAPSLDIAATEAEQLGEQIIRALKTPMLLDGRSHQVDACIGITLFRCPEATPADELLRQADIALKMAKRSNTIDISFFDQQMESSVKKHLEISQALNHAVENNELALALQPQVNAQGETVSFEALLRWQHPELGAVSPNDFIPIAEATESIISIGDWVLEKSCQMLAHWNEEKAFEHLGISVNVSSVQFRRGDFVERVKNILNSSGATPSKLRFELTESLLAEDIDDVVEQMESLRKLGVSFSLDDFGTGYASLAYLTRLPLNELKVDRAFVNDLGRHSKGALLAETIISLGRSMNLTVIAEGVETEQQFKRLQNMGCQHFQGYLFGKPSTNVKNYLPGKSL